jgi:hypothetical protein
MTAREFIVLPQINFLEPANQSEEVESMYPNANSLYASPLSQNVNPFAPNPFGLAGSMQNTIAPPFTNAPHGLHGMVPQNPTWLQSLPQQQNSLQFTPQQFIPQQFAPQQFSPQQFSPQFTPPHATIQLALQLAAQQLAQQLTGQQSNPIALQQALHQLAQFHYWVAQQLAQLAAIPVPQGLFGSPYANQFVPGAFGPTFGAGTLH